MTSDFAEKNRQVFEKKSRTYKSDFAKGVETLVNVAQSQRTWVSNVWTDTEAGKGKDLRMLEYACGPGHISLALAPFVSSVVGLDISDGMIEEFNKTVHEAGRSETITGIKANLLADSAPAEVSGPEYISKHGFSAEEMQKMYEDAGAGDGFKYQVIEERLEFTKDGNKFHKTIFVARGQK